MNPSTYVTIGLALLSLASTVATLLVTLRIRVAQLETEERILNEVDKKYFPRESAMDHDRRLARLERHRA